MRHVVVREFVLALTVLLVIAVVVFAILVTP